MPEIEGDGFEHLHIDWCYKKLIALHSLLTNLTLGKEENLSFLHAEDPTLPRYNKDRNEILVPIILYMDGIAIDNSGQMTITPLNMILGIFNTLTWNSRPDAWETIYFHPTPGTRDKGDKLIDNVNNLHSSLYAVLSSLKDACNLTDGIGWSNFLWNKKKWSVQMKFAVAYFIGDTISSKREKGKNTATRW
eukprot:jgi/Psemu1/27788/gm1.27788_g